jgi:hypothetical protein
MQHKKGLTSIFIHIYFKIIKKIIIVWILTMAVDKKIGMALRY